MAKANQSETLSSLALAGTAYFVVVIIGLRFLDRDASAFSRPVSDYAGGPQANLFTSALLALSFAVVAFAFALNQELRHSPRSRWGALLIGLFGASALVAAAFPGDLPNLARTTHGVVHHVANGAGFLLLSVGVALITVEFSRDPDWAPLYTPALMLAGLLVLAYIGTILGFMGGLGFGGAAERAFYAIFAAWLVVVASHIRSLAARTR